MVLIDTNVLYYLCELAQPPADFSIQQTLKSIKENRQKEKIAISPSISFFLNFCLNTKSKLELFDGYLHFAVIMVFAFVTMRICPSKKTIDRLIFAQHAKTSFRNILHKFCQLRSMLKLDLQRLFIYIYARDFFLLKLFPEGEPNDNQMKLFAGILNVESSIALDFFKVAFSYGYKTGNCESQIKESFNFLLENQIPQLLAFSEPLVKTVL